MKKEVTVKIAVQEPTISYEEDTQWERLERLAGNCPVPYSSCGYMFADTREVPGSFENLTIREYNYHNVTSEEAELVRVYWTQSEVEIGECPQIDIWNPDEDYPVLDTDEIEVRGLE